MKEKTEKQLIQYKNLKQIQRYLPIMMSSMQIIFKMIALSETSIGITKTIGKIK